MSNIKERLIGAITIMKEEQAKALWEHLLLLAVEEEAPDEWDLRMLEEIKNDPDCQTPASAEEVKKVLEDA